MIANGPDAGPENPAGHEMQDPGRAARPTEVTGWFTRARWLAVPAGVLAGLIAFGVGEATYQLIPARVVPVPTPGGAIVFAPTAPTQAVADVRNAALAFGVLGCCLGGCLGIAGGLARRAPAAATAAGLLGAILGAALSAGASLPLLPLLMGARITYPDYEIIISMMLHGVPWGLAGAAAGLAFAVGLGQRWLFDRAPAAGFTGAVLGAIAFDLIGAAFFPFADTGEPVSSTWPSRLLARLLVAVATAAAIILILPGPGSRPARVARAPEIASPGS